MRARPWAGGSARRRQARERASVHICRGAVDAREVGRETKSGTRQVGVDGLRGCRESHIHARENRRHTPKGSGLSPPAGASLFFSLFAARLIFALVGQCGGRQHGGHQQQPNAHAQPHESLLDHGPVLSMTSFEMGVPCAVAHQTPDGTSSTVAAIPQYQNPRDGCACGGLAP
jgi:hypothetical protein